MIRLMLIGFFMTMIIGILSYQVAYSSFLSSATSQNNTFSTSSDFGNEEVPAATPSATPIPGSIVINEVSPLGSSASAEWVELFNSGGSPVDVSGWIINDGNSGDTFPAVASIPAGGYAFVVTNNSVVSGIPSGITIITLDNGNIGSGLNNTGSESVQLRNGVILVDEMNYGVSTWPNAPTSGTVSRIPNGIDTNVGSDWQTNTTSTLGVSN